MSDLVSKFLDEVVEGNSDPKQRREARAEIEDHLLEKIEDLKRRGCSEEEAEKRAIEEMGNPKELSEQMSSVHSFIPHVYYHRTVILLLLGLLFAHFNFTIVGFNFFPSIVGTVLITLALIRFYGLSKSTKVAFWLYTVTAIVSRFVALFEKEYLSTEILVVFGVISSFVLPISMTLLLLPLVKKDEGHNGLKWVIGIEWTGLLIVLYAIITADIALPLIWMLVLLPLELILLGRFASRASKYEWDETRGLPISIPIVLAVVYFLSLLVPTIVEWRLNAYRPTAHEWTGTKQEVLIMNAEGEQLDYIEYASDWVNQVQQYMDEEDYQKLAGSEKLQRHEVYSLPHKSRYTVLAKDGNKTYFVVFYYFSNAKPFTKLKVDRALNYHSLELNIEEYEVHCRNFYQGPVGIMEYDVGQTKNGGYFYTFEEWDTFGYLFAEWKGNEHVAYQYQQQSHEMDFFHPERVDFEDGWSVWTQYG